MWADRATAKRAVKPGPVKKEILATFLLLSVPLPHFQNADRSVHGVCEGHCHPTLSLFGFLEPCPPGVYPHGSEACKGPFPETVDRLVLPGKPRPPSALWLLSSKLKKI